MPGPSGRVPRALMAPDEESPSTGRLSVGQLWLLFGFSVMLVHPVSRNWFIVPVFLSCAAVGLLRHVRAGRPPVPVSMVLVIITGIYLTLEGALLGTAGWKYVAVPLVLGPVVYLLIGLGLDRELVARLPSLVAFCTFVIATTILVLALGQRPAWMFWTDPIAGGTAIDGIYSVRLGAIGTLAGSIPFLAGYLASWQGPRGRKYALFVAVLVLAVVSVFFTGRTALVVISLLAITIAPLTRAIVLGQKPVAKVKTEQRKIFPTTYLLVSALCVTAVAVGLFSDLAPSAALNRVAAELGSSGSADIRSASSAQISDDREGAQVREEQAGRLIDGFLESPIIGQGGGAVAVGSIRNEDRPWEYEMQYHLLLFRGGLLAAGLYLLALGVGVQEIRRQWVGADVRTRHVTIAACCAAGGMLFANLSNPYLQAMGQQWALFLPVITIAAGQVRRAS